MKFSGGCYCGSIRYEGDCDAQMAMQCHCRECQYITGGHPNAIMIFPKDGVTFTKGEMASFTRSDIDTAVTRYFCPTCGTAIGTRTPRRPESVIIKVGTLDDPSVFKPQIAIYTVDKQSFHHIADDATSFERLPG